MDVALASVAGVEAGLLPREALSDFVDRPYPGLGGLGEVELTQPVQDVDPFYPEAGVYNLDITLTANQEVTDAGVFLDGDSDFELLSISGSSTAAYNIRLRTPRGKSYPQTYCKHSNLVGSAAFPTPLETPWRFPSTGKISVDLRDTSGASNTIQLLFRGRRLFRTR